MAKISDYFDFQNGYAFKSKDFIENGQYRIVKIKELKDGAVKFFKDSARINPPIDFNIDKYIIQKGDVLFALTGDPVSKSNPLSWVGRVSYYNHDEPALLNQRVCKVNPKANVTNDFLYYFFRQEAEFYNLAAKATGSASQANISTKTIGNHNIDLPNDVVMGKIVSILQSIDEKIETNEAINRNLYEQAYALVDDWEKLNQSEIEYKTVKEVADLNPESYTIKEKWKFVNYLDTSNITDGLIRELQYIEPGEVKLPSRARRKVIPKDIVYSTVRPNQKHYGLISQPDENMLVSTGFTVIRSKCSAMSNELIYLLITRNGVVDKLQQIAEHSTSTYPSIKSSDLGALEIPCIIKDGDRRLLSILEDNFKKIFKSQLENTRLSLIRDALLPKLMSGELDVSDMDI